MTNIKFKLTPAQKKKFKDSCFGHFLKSNDIQFSGHIVNSMLYRQCIYDDQDDMVFNFGGHTTRFTCTEFAIITGLYFSYEPNRRVNLSTCISDKYFGGKRKVTNSEIIEAFMTSQCQDDDEDDDDKLKLALLYFLETVLLGNESMVTDPYNHLKTVDDLDYFNKYPWGSLSYSTTIISLKSSFKYRESMAMNKSKTYSCLVGDVLDATEYEYSFIGKISWDVHHDTTSYRVVPVVRDKPP
ncbi:uncharacterized protein LOC132799397 [Ziziphus jujuba]|uniref:Uncharacterized protein LOC132799397 n=1 Tax=Ziziphus jujuba TaxID=326968 RepID=A0ABM3ZRT8_ZIZJJ|nr:uncharacterized protein LOC132799397 [Ziziphus jujuba]